MACRGERVNDCKQLTTITSEWLHVVLVLTNFIFMSLSSPHLLSLPCPGHCYTQTKAGGDSQGNRASQQ